MSKQSDWKKLRKAVIDQGLRLERSPGKHWKLFRGNEMVGVMPTSPGRGRALANQKAQLRRAGVEL